MKYKVWIQIEEIDEEKDHYENITEPECIAEFDSLKDAEEYADKIQDDLSRLKAGNSPEQANEQLVYSTDILSEVSQELKRLSSKAGAQVVENLKHIKP